jgi:hypothetical protein
MWIMLSDSFISVVALRDNPKGDTLLVRGRIKGDLDRLFPSMAVAETPDGDYAFRSFLTRTELVHALSEAVGKLDYPNFKESVRDPDRHDAYLECWEAMQEFQFWKKVEILDADSERRGPEGPSRRNGA